MSLSTWCSEAAALESELEEFEPGDDNASTIAERLGEIDDELEDLSGSVWWVWRCRAGLVPDWARPFTS